MTSRSSVGLSTQWTQHTKTKDEKDQLLKILSGHSTHLEVLSLILKTKLEAIEKESLAVATYDSPSWPYRQADYVGSIREIRNILTLIAPMTKGT